MNKEKEAEKIQIVYEKIIRHIILKFENRIKSSKDILIEDLESEKDFIRRINLTSATKREYRKNEASAQDQIKTAYEQSKLMLEALCIKSELTEKLLDSLATKADCEITDKLINEEADLDNLRDKVK